MELDQEIFEREIGMCRKLHAENGGWCRWGKCSECGVVPLLNKLAKGKVAESEEEIKQLKDEALCRK